MREKEEGAGLEKLTQAHRGEVLAYIAREPEYNVFLQGDIENYGFDGENVEVFGLRGKEGDLACVLLRYFKNFCLYCAGEAPAALIAAFLQERHAACLTGKAEQVAAVAAQMPGAQMRGTFLARLETGGAMEPELAKEAAVRMLTPSDAAQIIALERQILEFADSFQNASLEEKTAECRGNLLCGGHAWGVFVGGTLVAVAQTSAENSVSAMIVGVATLPAWRRRGFARACLGAAARHSFAAGRRYLCLFYDNPAAGRMYHALGFADVGRFGMLPLSL